MKQMIKKLAIVLSVALVCAPMGAMAANKLIVKDATGTIDKMVVNDSGYIGVGHNAPAFPVHIVGAGDPGLTAMFFHNTGRAAPLKAAGDSPGLNFFRNNVSTINGGLPENNDRLGYFSFGGKISGSNKATALVQSYAEGAWTLTSAPTNIKFFITKPNTVVGTEAMSISSLGQVKSNYGFQLATTNGANKAVCDATNGPVARGTFWYTLSGAGTADKLEICTKDAAGNYAWKAIAL